MVVPLVWWTILLILWILAAIYFYIRSLFDEHLDIYEKWTPIIAGKNMAFFVNLTELIIEIQTKRKFLSTTDLHFDREFIHKLLLLCVNEDFLAQTS